MVDEAYDVVVVGGSVAGCTAAVLYARGGLRVALLERSGDPGHHKSFCTHLLQPMAVSEKKNSSEAVLQTQGNASLSRQGREKAVCPVQQSA